LPRSGGALSGCVPSAAHVQECRGSGLRRCRNSGKVGALSLAHRSDFAATTMKMNKLKETSFTDRQSAAATVKRAALERHRDAAHDPGLAARQAAREAVKIARNSRVAERNATRVASKTREAAEKAGEEAARETVLQAEHAAHQAESKAKAANDLALEAEKQTAPNTPRPPVRLRSGRGGNGKGNKVRTLRGNVVRIKKLERR
jgi:hypothetical protein